MNGYILVYCVFAFFIMDYLGYLHEYSYQGWLTLGILCAIGVLSMTPAKSLIDKTKTLSKGPRIVIFVKNVAIILAAFCFGRNIYIILGGIVGIVCTILLFAKHQD